MRHGTLKIRKQRGFFVELGVLKTLLVIALIIAFVAGVSVATVLGANDTDDDDARGLINSSTCPELLARSNESWVDAIRKLLDGPTGDDDEQAINKLLGCLPCDRVTAVVNTVGRDNILDDIHGAEWDETMELMQKCGLVNLSAFDDDASRRLINIKSCDSLNAMSAADQRQLILNMFNGPTEDDDERAIIKLIECMPCARRKEIQGMSGTRFSDFDSDVHGSEWTKLEPLLKCN